MKRILGGVGFALLALGLAVEGRADTYSVQNMAGVGDFVPFQGGSGAFLYNLTGAFSIFGGEEAAIYSSNWKGCTMNGCLPGSVFDGYIFAGAVGYAVLNNTVDLIGGGAMDITWAPFILGQTSQTTFSEPGLISGVAPLCVTTNWENCAFPPQWDLFNFNEAGTLTFTFADQNGSYWLTDVGFVGPPSTAPPVPEPPALPLLGIGALAVAGLMAKRRNSCA